MFIELTDHLRCPADHDESFLVLIPDEMRGREVIRGTLGCPVCSREYPVVDGVARFGDALRVVTEPTGSVNAGALAAFLGLEGPGGYVGLLGEAASFAEELGAALPGVHLVTVNPPPGIKPAEGLSVLLSPRLPFKKRSLRGIVVGAPFSEQEGWSEAAIQAVLPGLRAAGHGATPRFEGFELMGEAEGWWVGRSQP